MVKLMGAIGATVASMVGGYLAKPLGLAGSFIVGTIAGGFGMYYAAKWAKNNLG
jgi:hypothetical protein